MDLKDTAKAILEKKDVLDSRRVLIGFDGFVDEIIHVVDSRNDKDNYTRIETIESFGKRIMSAAGKSTNMELVPRMRKLGGNGPIMSNAVSALGAEVTCIGLMGYPELDDVFKSLSERCRVVSIGDPGHTDALEFSDGKVMFGKLNTIPQMCWKGIQEKIGEEQFGKFILDADLVACTNWTMLTEINGVFDNIIRLVPDNSNTLFYFDLADPQKRPREEISGVLDQIRRLNSKAPCILGLNFKEAEQIADVMGLKQKPADGLEGLKDSAGRIRDKLGIHGTVIHSVKFASACINGICESAAGPYFPNPKITTGAGDHFNGGFCTGLLAGLPVGDAIYLGVGTSGWYVRNDGSSPSIEDVCGLLRDWSAGALDT